MEQKGLVHLYTGDGKGKTTAAVGLTVRAAGRGKPVVIAQFLKGEDSGERRILERLPQVNLLPLPETIQFTFAMSEEEKEKEKVRYQCMLKEIAYAAQVCELLILDEVCAAVNTGMISLQAILQLLDGLTCEIVMTGREPAQELEQRADYITCMEKVRHPYDEGICAREGIEY